MRLFILFSMTCLCLINKAQDTIVFKTNEKLPALVLLIGSDSIRYKKMDNIMGPDLYVKNSEVNYVHYKKGNKVSIDSLSTVNRIRALQNSKKADDPKEMYKLGVQHADVNYKCKGCTALSVAGAMVLGPLVAIPAVSVAYILPKEKNLAYPSDELWENESYKKGYKDQACRIKRHSIFRPAGLTVLVSSFAWTLVAAMQSSQN